MRIISTGRTISTPEFRARKKRRRRVVRNILIFALVMFISLIIYFARLDKIRIQEVAVTGVETVNAETVAEEASEVISGNYSFIFPKNHILLYPRTKLKEDLYNKFPQFKEVRLNLHGLQTLGLEVEERETFATYCNVMASSTECYLLDEGGFIFLLSATSTTQSYFSYTGGDMSGEVLGVQFISKDEFQDLTPFIESLKENLNVLPVSLNVSSEDYYLALDNGTQIIWKRDMPQEVILRDLGAFLADDVVVGNPNFWDEILYLDLRIPNKVFYRFNRL